LCFFSFSHFTPNKSIVSTSNFFFLVDCLVKTDWDWWKHTTFYHIYVKSFKDSNNDGIGDLQGIIQKLDHFCDAGVEAIWLSPIFQSPKMDQGYDISNYMDIDPDYGTIDDLKQLIDEAHEKGVKLLLDFVPNHTSDQHQWFKDSVNGVDQYRDFYIWAEPRIDAEGNKLPPNNWVSHNSSCLLM
jgi:alpha-glucosidase